MRNDKPIKPVVNINQAEAKRLEYLADQKFYRETGFLNPPVEEKPKSKRQYRKKDKKDVG